MYPNVRSLIGLCTVALGVSASSCDSQVSPEYTGESLLSITGNVEIASDAARGKLVPALGWKKTSGAGVLIMDVPVRGSFPSDFRLEVLEPPDASALTHVTFQTEAEPRVATSYITAVTADHPDIVYQANEINTTHYLCRDVGRSDGLCLRQSTASCITEAPEIPCYVEDTLCPSADAPTEDCIIEKKGDPALLISTWEGSTFAGFSQNYQVLYFEEEVPAGSLTAAFFDAEKGTAIPAGYGLYEVGRLSAEQFEEFLECTEEENLWKRALEMYNEAHGTDFPRLVCDGFLAALPPFCHGDYPTDKDKFLQLAAVEAGCRLSQTIYKRVKDPANESISVVIGSELRP